MNIVIPMAGRGNRFAQKGIQTPKPLIDVRGRPMYSWAVESLPLTPSSRLIFICLKEHLQLSVVEQDIRKRYRRFNPVIIGLDQVPEGQACTVLMARSLIDTAEPLIIYNADTYCRLESEALKARADGMINVFKAFGNQWSFAKTDEQGRIIQVAEKNRISDWACTGLYYFAHGHDFVRYADAMIAANERVNNEFRTVAPVYNRMISDGKVIMIDIAKEVWVMGTPEDLDYFQAHCPYGQPIASSCSSN